MSAKLSDVGEFGLIKKLSQGISLSSSVKVGIGDDTAVIDISSEKQLLLTTDMLVEGVHFAKEENPYYIGRKALAVSISDIAAMGGMPKSAVISLGVPDRKSVDFVQKLYRGIKKLARDFCVDIVGGDSVRSEKLILNIALTGYAKKNEIITRSGAKAGDVIFVTGPLGNSYASRHHLRFVPRIKESQFLVKKIEPSAMIDISDGLVSDLGHVLKASQVSALLEEFKIPLRKGANKQKALSEGEDFELLFTVSPRKAALMKYRKSPFPFYEIGKIVAKKEPFCLLDLKGKRKKINAKGFTHF